MEQERERQRVALAPRPRVARKSFAMIAARLSSEICETSSVLKILSILPFKGGGGKKTFEILLDNISDSGIIRADKTKTFQQGTKAMINNISLIKEGRVRTELMTDMGGVAVFSDSPTVEQLRIGVLFRVAMPFLQLATKGKIVMDDVVLLDDDGTEDIHVDVKFTDAKGNIEWLCFVVDRKTSDIERWDFQGGPFSWGSIDPRVDNDRFDTKVMEAWGDDG